MASGITEQDIWLFREGKHSRLYEKMGAVPDREGALEGFRFTVWAPAVESVSLLGDFNHWNLSSHRMEPVGDTGLHTIFVPGLGPGVRYKFHIVSKYDNYRMDKADPFARNAELPPATASVLALPEDLFTWNDQGWIKNRKNSSFEKSAVSVYEMHAGSWLRGAGSPGKFDQILDRLIGHLNDTGFTHVELMPITLHPFSRSWGYQTTGYFCVHPAFGTPDVFHRFVDTLHRNGIGVILDWVPSHFPVDDHGPGRFDGTHLFEYPDARKGFHPDWKSYIFDYGRPEVRSFLISSALYWIEKFHIDGLRVDAVASMLYLDYSRKDGEWIANRFGGNEHLEAIQFLQDLNESVHREFPDVMMIAEESTAWPGVTDRKEGLRFDMKWDMGWMHDTLEYMKKDPVFRSGLQNQLTFRMSYAWSEKFMLSLSHDEVVYGKKSLLEKMPGDDWRKFANLRLLYSWMWATPGKKLLFMGGEFGQRTEWNEDESIPLHLKDQGLHGGIRLLIRDLNRIYRSEPSFYKTDFDPEGFEWIDVNDHSQSILSFLRQSPEDGGAVLAIFNFTPVPRFRYRIGFPAAGIWEEFFNSDSHFYGGSGSGNQGMVTVEEIPFHSRDYSAELTLPPLGAIFFRQKGQG